MKPSDTGQQFHLDADRAKIPEQNSCISSVLFVDDIAILNVKCRKPYSIIFTLRYEKPPNQNRKIKKY